MMAICTTDAAYIKHLGHGCNRPSVFTPTRMLSLVPESVERWKICQRALPFIVVLQLLKGIVRFC